jgi:hypothetical protein
MFDAFRPAMIGEARCQASQQTDSLIGLAKQQCAAIAGQRATIKICNYPLGEMGCKLEVRLGTPCFSQGRSFLTSKHLRIQMSMPD